MSKVGRVKISHLALVGAIEALGTRVNDGAIMHGSGPRGDLRHSSRFSASSALDEPQAFAFGLLGWESVSGLSVRGIERCTTGLGRWQLGGKMVLVVVRLLERNLNYESLGRNESVAGDAPAGIEVTVHG